MLNRTVFLLRPRVVAIVSGVVAALPVAAQEPVEDPAELGDVLVLGRAKNLVGSAISASEGRAGQPEIDSRPILPAVRLLSRPALLSHLVGDALEQGGCPVAGARRDRLGLGVEAFEPSQGHFFGQVLLVEHDHLGDVDGALDGIREVVGALAFDDGRLLILLALLGRRINPLTINAFRSIFPGLFRPFGALLTNRNGSNRQTPSLQVRVRKDERVRLVKMKPEPKQEG